MIVFVSSDFISSSKLILVAPLLGLIFFQRPVTPIFLYTGEKIDFMKKTHIHPRRNSNWICFCVICGWWGGYFEWKWALEMRWVDGWVSIFVFCFWRFVCLSGEIARPRPISLRACLMKVPKMNFQFYTFTRLSEIFDRNWIRLWPLKGERICF